MRARPSSLFASLVVAAAVALSACSDDGGEAADTTTTTVDSTTVVTGAPAVDTDPCTLLEAEEVAASLGIPIGSVDGSAQVAKCVWAPELAEIALQMIAIPTKQDFEVLLGRHAGVFGDPVEIDGLGTQAFYFDQDGVARILVFREGGLSFELDMVHKDYPEMTDDHRGALESLAGLAADRL